MVPSIQEIFAIPGVVALAFPEGAVRWIAFVLVSVILSVIIGGVAGLALAAVWKGFLYCFSRTVGHPFVFTRRMAVIISAILGVLWVGISLHLLFGAIDTGAYETMGGRGQSQHRIYWLDGTKLDFAWALFEDGAKIFGFWALFTAALLMSSRGSKT